MSVQTARPRIAPLEPPYESEIDALLKKWMPPGADTEPLRLFRTLAPKASNRELLYWYAAILKRSKESF